MTDPTPVVGTYDPSLLSLRDRVRSTVGDVGPEFLVPDSTYDAQLGLEDDWRLAAAAIADQLAGMFNQRTNSYTQVGDFSATYLDRAGKWSRQAQQLRAAVAAEREHHTTGYSVSRPTRDDDPDPWEYTVPRF